MKLDDLVPVLDIERPISVRRMEECAEVLDGEGWSHEQIKQWAYVTFALQRSALKVQCGGRRN